jgi:ubiquinol-cytochrome c reductase cytochrome c subunit
VRRLSARLSATRRSRYAAPVVLLLALLTTGGVYDVVVDRAIAPPAHAAESDYDQDTVAAGRALYLVGCSSCHGLNGEGVTTKSGKQYGPSLVGVGAAAVDFQVGTGRMPMAAPEAQAPVKEKVYDEEEVEQLAAYVASLGPGPAIPEAEKYDPETIPEDERAEAVVRGGEFFRTNCTACHNFAASGGALPGGKYAPSLIGVEPVHIYEALITGPQQMPVFSDEVLTPEEKRDVIAYIESIEEAPKYGGFAMGALGPVSEGLFAWVVGIGGLVVFAIWIASHTARTTRKGASQ